VFVPRTEKVNFKKRTSFVDPWILLHEIGHTMQVDAIHKYIPDRGYNGKQYYDQLVAAQKDKNVPREVKRAITLYIIFFSIYILFTSLIVSL
jgi:hypothetical protein